MINSNLNWDRALKLKERFQFLKQEEKSSIYLAEYSDTSNQKINQWKSQSPFDKQNYFIQRLDAANITEADLDYFLNEPIAVLKNPASG